MKAAEPVFVRNFLIDSDLKKYIFFRENAELKEDALTVFCQFLVEEIYIDGFASDEEIYIGKSVFHKPVVDVRSLKEEEAVVFIKQEYEEKIYDICQPITVVNPLLNKNNIVIWGAGKYGSEVLGQLFNKKVKGINCYIDSDKTKCGVGKYKENIPVYSTDDLLKMPEDISIIEAAEKYEEMETFLRRRNCIQKRFYYENTHNKYLKYITTADDDLPIIIQYIYHMCLFFENKKIYIYGDKTKRNCKIAKCIRLLDFDFEGFLCDICEENENREYSSRILEDILYEDNFFIVLENDKVKTERLLNLGLRKNYDFNILPQLSFSDYIMESVLDLNLGYTYKGNNGYWGITVYGEEKEDNFKIAVLGGSTTDDGYDKRNWARILYEKCKNKNITIYNGGTCGYTSSQELIKLERDILSLKPDLVIVYDGFNDLCENPSYSFAIPYLQSIFEVAKSRIDKESQGYGGNNLNDEYVNMGIASKENHFENWLSKVKMMHAVAQSKNIDFLAFVQPSRYMSYKKENDDWLMSSCIFWIERWGEPSRTFRQMIESNKIEETYDYIINLTALFDDRTELFKDSCHLYEAGNELVADQILHVIEEKGFIN